MTTSNYLKNDIDFYSNSASVHIMIIVESKSYSQLYICIALIDIYIYMNICRCVAGCLIIWLNPVLRNYLFLFFFLFEAWIALFQLKIETNIYFIFLVFILYSLYLWIIGVSLMKIALESLEIRCNINALNFLKLFYLKVLKPPTTGKGICWSLVYFYNNKEHSTIFYVCR